MSQAFTLKNLSVTRKLGLGFGLLLSFALLLSLLGGFGLQNSSASLKRISFISSLFDEIVFTREANYNLALSSDAQHQALHQEHHAKLKQGFDQLVLDAREGRWPAQDLGAAQKLRADLDTYSTARDQARSVAELTAANQLLSRLQDGANELYYAEEARASEQVKSTHMGLAVVTLVAILCGIAVALLISRQIVYPLRQAVQAAQRIAGGDLTADIKVERSDELGVLLGALNTMNASLREVISQIGCGSQQLAASASQLAAITSTTQEGIDSQRNETDMVATAMNEIAMTVQEVAKNSEEAASAAKGADHEVSSVLAMSQQAIRQIEEMASGVGTSAESLGRLQQECGRIGAILDVIKAVAEQTNLLALNAAIEAARAGDAGRGFAVVADEVRNLAQRTQASSSEIEQLIVTLQHIADESTGMMKTNLQQTSASVTGVRDTGMALEHITRQVSNIQQMSELIATAAEEQAAVTEEINQSVTRVRETAEESATASAEISAASTELKHLSNRLHGMVGHFRF
ncbi:methyl-accepting chemotaxis protein [Pseudomonas sp. 20P_3.2_Bac4]|nr:MULTISPECIES: methyl-accepting chemotaxis protein [unclassified Pseudomonas]MCU1733559.1 methyl-accepting chemotaxis protein [Pseudomonas sp. 20P_3.2_Bac4]MCU1742471.1 methyl-accepting chemotaxis protein [Pseudomonas sp. 20P_3.2_Bac5]